MRLRPRLWPFVFAPQSAQVPPCPVSVQCAVACARAARCSPPSPQLAHAMCRGWPKSRPHLPRRRRTLMPHMPLRSTAPPSASPPSHAVCRCARLRLLLLMLLHKMLIPAEPRMWQNQSRPDGQVERRFKAAFDSGRSCRPCDDSQTKISKATRRHRASPNLRLRPQMAGRGPEGPLHTDARLAFFSTFEWDAERVG